MNDTKPAPRPRPLPTPTPTSQGFWDAAKQHKLALQWDPTARRYQFWPRTISMKTGKGNLVWKEVSGLGKLYSYTITHVPMPGFENVAPYPIGLVELDEGVRIIANLVNVKNDEIKIGMRLKVTWEARSDDINYFAFEPA